MNHNNTNENELELNEREASAARKAGAVKSNDDPAGVTGSGLQETKSGVRQTDPGLSGEAVTEFPSPAPTVGLYRGSDVSEYKAPRSNLPLEVSQSQIADENRAFWGDRDRGNVGPFRAEADND